jgi:hypothetical protein
VDRAAIARVVETVLAAQGIARGSGAVKSVPVDAPAQSPADAPVAVPAPEAAPSKKESANATSIAAEIADRLFGSPAKPKEVFSSDAARGGELALSVTTTPVPASAKKPEPPAKAAIEIQVFVSENDVRRAMTRSEKIFIGRKTILTPSARDLGLEHEVFVETETGSIR